MCLCTSWKLYAQNNDIVEIKGRIIDKQKKGIQKVDVQDVQGRRITYTDHKIGFRFLFPKSAVKYVSSQVILKNHLPYRFHIQAKT